MSKGRLPLTKNIPQYGYYGAVINDAFINGAKGEPSLDFDQLDSREQATWASLAQAEGYNTIRFYNEYGYQISLTHLQTFLIMKLQEKYNLQVENNADWKKSNWMMDGTGDYGIVYTNSCELSREIFGVSHGNRLTQIQNAIMDMVNSRGFIAYYERDKEGKPFLRVEKTSLITCGIDVVDKRHKAFSWIRLHRAFFGRIRDRHIRCRNHTELMSQFFNYKLPTMATMILVRFLMKFGTVKKNPVEIGATKMLLMLCPTEFKYRRRTQYTKLVKQACDACKHIGIITGYDDTQTGKNGELKYAFEINPNFFRNNT